ncbi:hypothetical protein Cthiooxydans_30300 [Comamonas thiooxydans]|uniref:hypothetical protein n=1 Tax=Comamonas thiooxydans TaxID=363952 RepID=UPI001E5D7C6C|nr:hypothetical protein [Comamonas thiooxydans]BDB70618.1 hypothetical protein Cthiooxydans_30300 [Comamonas thiooxydans]
MAEESTSTPEPSNERTAQQWAWQFLRRNPEYLMAYEMLSALTWEQFSQLQFLIAQAQNLLVSDLFLDEKIIRTIDIRFFESEGLEMLDEKIKETIGEYIDRTSNFPGLEEKIIFRVSKRYWLETYCLVEWRDPLKFLEVDIDTAAHMWRYTPFIELGTVATPWLERIKGIDSEGFKPLKRSKRGKGYELNDQMVRGADGSIFMRSATVWGDDYVTPSLGVTEVDIRFDLEFPLDFQLKNAEKELLKQYSLLIKANILEKTPKHVDRFGLYQEYIMILDEYNNGADINKLALKFGDGIVEKVVRWKRKNNSVPVPERGLINPGRPSDDREKITEGVRQKLVRAIKLRDQNYKKLAFLRC